MVHKRFPFIVTQRCNGAFFRDGTIHVVKVLFLGGTYIAEGLSEEALYKPFLPLTHLCPQQTWTSDMKEHEYKSDISKN